MAVYEPWPQLYSPSLNLNVGGPLICSAGRAMYLQPPKVEIPAMHIGQRGIGIELHMGTEADCQSCGWLYR